MNLQLIISGTLLFETAIFLTEVIYSSFHPHNRSLLKARSLKQVRFVDLQKGYKTRISYFRISIIAAYLFLVVILFNKNQDNIAELLFLYVFIGLLLYLAILYNIKVFAFGVEGFSVTAPFNFLTKKISVRYADIKDFQLYKALYNAYYLIITTKKGDHIRIHFSASSIPRNDLVIQFVLNAATGLKKTVDMEE